MTHAEKIQDIALQVKSRAGSNQAVKIQKSEVSHFVPNPYDKRNRLPKIKINDLNNIISIDPQKRICVAEPGISFSKLVKETLKHHLIPYTVPELKTITIGGAVSGCSIESMSYKYGGFHDSCIEYEIITGTGDILNCSPTNNSDIFHMIHGSYGTLGIITQLKFKLLPAKRFVKMDYFHFDNFDDYWNFTQSKFETNEFDFIDGIIHSNKDFVACLGKMTNIAPQISKYDWLNIFYKSTLSKKEDYLTIYDYFFRYDTECHWLTKTIPLLETKPVRFALGRFILGSTNLIKWSRRLKGIMKLKKRPEVVVDVFIPKKNFESFFKWYEKDFDFYPLWIVPYKAPETYPWINDDYGKKMDGNFFIDCAVYGKKNTDPKIDYSELLEKKTIELNGIKTLISRNHFDKDTFWSIYNNKRYCTIKGKTDPNNLFNDLYEKFGPSNYK